MFGHIRVHKPGHVRALRCERTVAVPPHPDPKHITAVALVLLALGVSSSAQGPAHAPQTPAAGGEETAGTTAVAAPAALAGHWRSSAFEIALTSDLHRSIYGPGARSVRQVEMTLQASGDGVFTTTSSVRDRSGRVVAGTQQIEEVKFVVGELQRPAGQQPRYASGIAHAERRFADDPKSAFPLEGVKLWLYPAESAKGTLEVRYEPPEGTGSFWETLRRMPPGARRTGPAS